MKSNPRIQINPNEEPAIAGTIYNAIMKDTRPRLDHYDRFVGPIMERDGDIYIHIGNKENGTEIWRECVYNEMGGGHLGEKKLIVVRSTFKDHKNYRYGYRNQTGQ